MRAGACVRCKAFPFVHFKVSEAALRCYTRWLPHALRRLERKKQHQRVTSRRADRNMMQQVAVEGKKKTLICVALKALLFVQFRLNPTNTCRQRFSGSGSVQAEPPPVRSEHFIGVLTCFSFFSLCFFLTFEKFFFFFLQYTTACQLHRRYMTPPRGAGLFRLDARRALWSSLVLQDSER